MNIAVQATCPGCKRVLRIPAVWVGHVLRCKFCGDTSQAQRRPRGPTPVPGAAPFPVGPAVPGVDAPPAPGYPASTPAIPMPTWEPLPYPTNGAGSYPPVNGYPPPGYPPPMPGYGYPMPEAPPQVYTPEPSYTPAFESSGARHRRRGRYRGPASASASTLITVGAVVLLMTGAFALIIARPDLFSGKPPEKGGPPVVAVKEKEKEKEKGGTTE